MRCLVKSRDLGSESDFTLQGLAKNYLIESAKMVEISKDSSLYLQSYDMPHTRGQAHWNASPYTKKVRQPFDGDITGTLYDLENYTISINDRGGRLSCTFLRRIDIKIGDIVYMVYTTSKCSKIAGRFEVDAVSTTNNATTITALDTVAILNTMNVSLSIGASIPPEMALEYLGEQINIPIYVREGTTLRFSAGGVRLNSRPREIIDEYINSNTTVCLDDLGILAIKPVDFTDYYITLGACRGDWSLEIQFHNDYLTRTRLINPVDTINATSYWDYGAELLYGKTHATDSETRPLLYKGYKVGTTKPPTVAWIDNHIDSGEFSMVKEVVDISQFSHMQASKKRMSYILVAKDLPVCYDLCPGDVVIVCYQYGSYSPKNCLMRVIDITFANDRMTLRGHLHLTQHPIKYAPVQIAGGDRMYPVNIDVMPDIDIHRWQLANPNG